MADGVLLLGPVLFRGFEMPESIRWGGAQRLAIHRMPGGGRVIDAMGRDDADIAWSGVFTGPDGGTRARLLDLMRAEGGVWPLTWDSFFYSVVLSRFEADYRRPNWIPYRMACTVLRDEVAALVDGTLSLAADALADVSAADAQGSGVDLSGAMAAVGLTDAGSANTQDHGAAMAQLGWALDGAGAGIGSAEARLGAAPADVAGFSVASDAAGQLAALVMAQGYLRRAQANLAAAGA
jgi:hypothetical protein